MSSKSTDTTAEARAGLVRGLGLVGATSIVIGTVIGTGIFRVPSRIAQEVDTAGMIFLVWIVAGLLSLFGALTYAELGASMPAAGGEYVYLKKAYGPLWGFLYGWMMFWVGRAGSIAALSTGFTDYLGHFLNLGAVFYSHAFQIFSLKYTFTLGTKQLASILVIFFLTLINYFGVRTGGLVQTFFTVLKVGIIVLLAFLGFAMANGSFGHFTPLLPSKREAGMFSAFGVAMLSALWAYDGWNDVNMVAGEIKNPAKNLPRALVFGMVSVMAIYLLANLAYIYILPVATIKGSPLVAATAAEAFLGRWGASFFATAPLISAFAALNGSILSGARIYYAMAADKLFFHKIAAIHPIYRTPTVSLTAQSVLAALLTLMGNYDWLTDCVIFAQWVFYAMATASIFVFRRKYPALERPYKLRFYPYIPAIFVLLAVLLLINTLHTRPEESLFGLVLILLGLPAYFYWRQRLRLDVR